MARTLDPEGAHLAALRRLGDFRGRRVLEMGCGEGRLTLGIALEAAHVVAFDANRAGCGGCELRDLASAVARRHCPAP